MRCRTCPRPRVIGNQCIRCFVRYSPSVRRYNRSSWFSAHLPQFAALLQARYRGIAAGIDDVGDPLELVEVFYHSPYGTFMPITRFRGAKVRFLEVIRRADEAAKKERDNGTAES